MSEGGKERQRSELVSNNLCREGTIFPHLTVRKRNLSSQRMGSHLNVRNLMEIACGHKKLRKQQ